MSCPVLSCPVRVFFKGFSSLRFHGTRGLFDLPGFFVIVGDFACKKRGMPLTFDCTEVTGSVFYQI